MGDPPRAVVPDHDPQDGSNLDQQRLLHEFRDEPMPTLSDIYSNPFPPDLNFPSCDFFSNRQFSPPQSSFEAEAEAGAGAGARAVPGNQSMFMFGSMPTGSTSGFAYGSSSQGAGPSGSNDGAGPSNTQNMDIDNPRPLPEWPVLPQPYKCSCCLVLREIIYSNDRHLVKLELHGRLGVISHAILETRQGFEANQDGTTYHMIDFLKKSLDDVRRYLWNYCEEKSLAGYKLIPDSLSSFYEAVCVGLIWDDIVVDEFDDYVGADPQNPEAHQDVPLPPPNDPLPPLNGPPPPPDGPLPPPNGPPENPPPAHQQPLPPPDQQPLPVQNNNALAEANPQAANNQAEDGRTFLAVQRERSANMSLRDLAQWFHLPIEGAAQRLNLCPTVVKRICRRYGIGRWPHRKIVSIKRLIAKLRRKLANKNEQQRQASQAEIQSLEQMIDEMRYGVPEPVEG